MAVTNRGSMAPTQQIKTSGSGTYTTPAGVKWIKIRMVGGGAGAGSVGAGGNTTFSVFGGSAILTANGGAIGSGSWPNAGGAGGSGTINAPAVGVVLKGGGGASGFSYLNAMGGVGGSSFLSGGMESASVTAGSVGGVSGTSYGNGGSGSATYSGTAYCGGGAGGGIEAIITSPSAQYSYSVGAGGVSSNSGNGFAGVIIVDEYY
jgi:hypothetical protein